MPNQKEIKDFIESVVQGLTKKGVKVTSAGFLKLDEGQKDKDESMDQAIKSVLEKLGLNPKERETKKETNYLKKDKESEAEFCSCSQCFNFQTFEEVLSKYGGKFDYKTVELGNKFFDLKYYSDESGREHMMIAPSSVPTKGQHTLEELQEQLNEAVKNKHFEKAQSLLNLINSIKNKK